MARPWFSGRCESCEGSVLSSAYVMLFLQGRLKEECEALDAAKLSKKQPQ